MPDQRAFVAINHEDLGEFYGPYDFDTERRRRDYYYDMGTCEDDGSHQVIEIIKRPNGNWEHIGPHV